MLILFNLLFKLLNK